MADITSTAQPARNPTILFIRRLLKRKTVAAGLIVLLVFVLLAVFAPMIAPYSPSKLSIVNRLKPPSELYWFGTDEFGRDVFPVPSLREGCRFWSGPPWWRCRR